MPDTAASAWAPLRITIFRTLWIAVLVSNVGTWMQTVGAQWLLVHDTHAAILVPLVQTATALPAVLFAPLAGVLADILDRRRLLLSVLLGMTAVGVALTVLTAADRMPASLLLAFTFALGAGAILIAPAYQSLVPNLVPRDQRQTGTDVDFHDAAFALSDPPPTTTHYLDVVSVHERPRRRAPMA